MSSDPTLSTPKATPAPAAAPAGRVPAPSPRLHLRRVVVACPEPQLGEAIEHVLRQHGDELAPEGLEVRRVHDGLTCLQDIQLIRPSLLILHAGLDRMNAAEILQAWEAAHPGDALPAVVLSAAFGSDVPRGMPGAVVVKLPFDNAELVAVASRAMRIEDSAGA